MVSFGEACHSGLAGRRKDMVIDVVSCEAKSHCSTNLVKETGIIEEIDTKSREIKGEHSGGFMVIRMLPQISAPTPRDAHMGYPDMRSMQIMHQPLS